MLNVIRAIAGCERELMLERQADGVASAKAVAKVARELGLSIASAQLRSPPSTTAQVKMMLDVTQAGTEHELMLKREPDGISATEFCGAM